MFDTSQTTISTAEQAIADQSQELQRMQKQREVSQNYFSEIMTASSVTDFVYLNDGWLKEKYLQFADGLRMELKRMSVEGQSKASAALFDVVNISAALKASQEYERLETGIAIKYEQVLRRLFEDGHVYVGFESRPAEIPKTDQDIKALFGSLFDHFRLGTPMNPGARRANLEAATACMMLAQLERSHYMLICGDFTITKKGKQYHLSHNHAFARIHGQPVRIIGTISHDGIVHGNDVIFDASPMTLKLTVLGIILKNEVTATDGEPYISLLIQAVQL